MNPSRTGSSSEEIHVCTQSFRGFTMTGRVKVYENPQGRFASVGDGAAF